jgi:hypothetical protein
MIRSLVETAKHAVVLGQSTANSCCVVGELPFNQFTPSVVRIVLPASPTATQALRLAQLTRFRPLVDGEALAVHVAQPLVVERMPPVPFEYMPAAKHTVTLGHEIPPG